MVPNLSRTVFGIVKVKFITDIAEEPWWNRPTTEKKAKNLLEKSLSSTWTTLRWRWSRLARRGCRRTRRAPAWSSGRRSYAACPRSRSSGTRPLITKILYNIFGNCLWGLCSVYTSHAAWKPSLKGIWIVCISWQVILESYPCFLKSYLESYPNSMCF